MPVVVSVLVSVTVVTDDVLDVDTDVYVALETILVLDRDVVLDLLVDVKL